MPVYRLPDNMNPPIFPPPHKAIEEGLLAIGGNLRPESLMLAYKSGIFPWYSKGEPIMWWSPDPRFILYPQNFHCPGSLKKVIRKHNYEIRFDTDFKSVIDHCSKVPREGQHGTWITREMQNAYLELHKLGYAHSVETYYNGQLAGGLYGLSFGGMFAGESMFSLADNASKLAFAKLVEVLIARNFDFIDCQVETENLARFGACSVPRKTFLEQLKTAVAKPDFCDFKGLNID